VENSEKRRRPGYTRKKLFNILAPGITILSLIYMDTIKARHVSY